MKSLGLFLAGLLFSIGAHAQTPTVKVVEFYSSTMDHYFLTPHPEEQDAIDRGAIKGWQRTGYSFLGYLTNSAGLSGVCRFYFTNFVVDSHFYTASSAECEKLIREKIWQLEETGFYVRTPDVFGQCPATTQPIQRLYNNGQGGAPNHRYLSDAALIQQMRDRGWVLEGPVFCAPVEGSSSTPPPPNPEPPPPPLPPPADPTNSLGIYCPGATGTRIVRMDWPTSDTFKRVATDSLAGEAMVYVLDVPYGVDPNNLYRLVGIYYQTRARPVRRASLSATPCDFSASLGPVSYVESTQLNFPFQVGNGSTYVIRLEPGRTYYISVQNLTCGSDENCRFVLDLYP